MGGASTAAPLDAIGANYWNPAAISGLSQSEVALGGQLAFPDIYVSSAFRGQGATTRSDSGALLIPGLALVYRSEDMPRVTVGTGMYVAGGGVNFPGNPSNPIFAPQGPAARFVLGPSYGNMAFLQVSSNVSVQVTDRLAIGAGPVIDYCTVNLDPAFFAPADDANGDGVRTFPAATHSRPFWGAGFKVGAYYHVTPTIDMGFGYTSPQWLETWFFHSRDELGNPRELSLKATLPPIYSWGLAYKGIEGLTLATDLRYIPYTNATLFGTPVVNGGLGWQDVFAVAVGAQYEFSEKLSARVGYVYNTNPIPTTGTLFNIQAPAITQNTISAGATVRLADNIYSSFAYAYAFQNSISGPVIEATAAGTGTTIQTSMHSVFVSLTIRFGGASRCDADPAPSAATCTPTVDARTPIADVNRPQ